MNCYVQIDNLEIKNIFEFAQEKFMLSYSRFDGNVTEFNANGDNDFFVTQHDDGYVFLWKNGLVNKFRRMFNKVLTIPIHDVIILSTPANSCYQWHNEGMEHTEHCNSVYAQTINLARRSVGLNYPLTKADLSKSKIEWATGNDKVNELLIDGYKNIYNKEVLNGNIPNQPQLENHLKLRGLADEDSEEQSKIFTATYDSGEGVRIRSGHSVVYNEELLTNIDEYYGMPVPTVVRTNEWHRINNKECSETRIMCSVSFDSEYTFDDIQKLITNNEFIK
ncbi:hypothetical protein OAQ62_00090 [bacterium]|nr:hypothetical protein [bacterium]